MIIASSTPLRAVRLGLRTRLNLAFAVLCLLLLIIIVVALVGVGRIYQTAYQAVELDGRQSRLAHQISVQALQCRRYEKDMFLNIDDAAIRADYLTKWERAYGALGTAIEQFAAIAPNPEERDLATQWQDARAVYGQAVVSTYDAISAGRITTPQAANLALTPQKNSIRLLTDRAVTFAEQAADRALQSERSLDREVLMTRWVIVGVGLVLLVAAAIWSYLFPKQLMQPITALQQATMDLAQGDLAARVAITTDDELGLLGERFNQMATTLQQRNQELEQQTASAQEALGAAEAARAQVTAQFAQIAEQQQVIAQMSVPILPLTETTLVLPLVGTLDAQRLLLAQERTLAAIQRSATRILIIDITGVPVVDSAVAQGLITLVQAARLLGAQTMLVGIRPEVAQEMVGQGLDLQNILTSSTLQSGVLYALSAGNAARGALRGTQ